MKGFKNFILICLVLVVLVPTASALAAANYVVLSWNDVGMHFYVRSFQDLAVLPPGNNLWAQVIKVGNPPQIVTSGITVTYSFPDNTYSVGKSNFWTYFNQFLGMAFLPNIGLKGKGLSGTMDLQVDHFQAVGIPLTEFRDSDLINPYPYQLANIVVTDNTSKAVLSQTTVVAPVSTEMHCGNCHSDGGVGGVATGRVETNILTLHDDINGTGLMNRRPVVCAECHSSNAIGAQGDAGLPSLSNAIHFRHAGIVTQDMNGCYSCHPGPQTKFLRDVMLQKKGLTCNNCHGTMSTVAQNPSPWLNEPRCDSAACHGSAFAQDQPLYRNSKGHGAVYCAGCHDSAHAIAPSREPNDRIKFVNLQGYPQTLGKCTVCHSSWPTTPGPHGILRAGRPLPAGIPLLLD